MFLEQHIYGKFPNTDFQTLLKTSEIKNIKELEEKSVFFIPDDIYQDEEKEKLNKYLYYPLDNNNFVIGKGIYDNKDESLREKYLFHNLILSLNDFEKEKFNPLKILLSINEFNTKKALSEEKISSIDFNLAVNIEYKSFIKDYNDIFNNILDICFNFKKEDPFYIIGTEKDIFNFLLELYEILPDKITKEISFNSLYYKDYKKFFFRGVPDEGLVKEKYSIKLNLISKNYKITQKNEINENENYYNLISELALKNIPLLHKFYTLEEELKLNDFSNFISIFSEIAKISSNTYIYDKNITLIKTLIIKDNLELFIKLKSVLLLDDTMLLLKEKRIFENIKNYQNKEEFLAFFIELLESRKLNEFYENHIYKFFIDSTELLFLLLDKIEKNDFSPKIENTYIKQFILIISKITKIEDYNNTKKLLLIKKIINLFNNKNKLDTIKKIVSNMPTFALSKENLDYEKFLLSDAIIELKLGKNDLLNNFLNKHKNIAYKIMLKGITNNITIFDKKPFNFDDLKEMVSKKNVSAIKPILLNLLLNSYNKSIISSQDFYEVSKEIFDLNNEVLSSYLYILEYKSSNESNKLDVNNKLIFSYIETGFLASINEDFKSFKKEPDPEIKLKKSKKKSIVDIVKDLLIWRNNS